MSTEEDIKDFSVIGDFLRFRKEYEENLPISNMLREINERSALYLEFLAGAFLKETGLKASEAELVCYIGVDTIRWKFVKRENAN